MVIWISENVDHLTKLKTHAINVSLFQALLYELMKEKDIRKQSMYRKITASVLSKLFTSRNGRFQYIVYMCKINDN